ncbi:glycosyltransferase family 4 protein [Candidatus Peregrinibacteria bacterium]|nr:glycosyltransferase family 4 protein [Candidatus Peregrinibacteria bacterium]MBI3816666.1 glycosyltransferase family 4 protein [Candidatus Peregrinibacteria bacterium]
MHLAIDVREACRAHRTGKGQWTFGFVSQLLTRDLRLTLLSDASPPASWDARKFSLKKIDRRGLRWHLAAASALHSLENLDAYVSPTSFLVPSLLGRSVPCIPIVHDLIAFRGEPHDCKATIIERLTLGRSVRSASVVCTISESTKADLLARYPLLPKDRIRPIFAGPMHATVPPRNTDSKTILCIATLSPRKNQLRLIQAYAQLPDTLRTRYRLVLAGGRGWRDDPILRLARQTPGVVWHGYASPSDYDALLSSCTVFAIPSLYEGFGMQILDALQRGIPVLTSHVGSIPEVCGEAAQYVDPLNVSSIALGLEELLENAGLRDELSKQGPKRAALFSWKRTVDLFLDELSLLRND